MVTLVDDVQTHAVTPSGVDGRSSFTIKSTNRLIICGYTSLVCCLAILPSLVYFGMRLHIMNVAPMILNTISFFILFFGTLLTLAMTLTKEPCLSMASYVDVIFSILTSFSMFAGNLVFAQMDLINHSEIISTEGFLYFNVAVAIVNIMVKIVQGVILSVMLGHLALESRRARTVRQATQNIPSTPPHIVNISAN